MTEPVLSVERLSVRYPEGRRGLLGPHRFFLAVDHVDFTVGQSKVLGLVGESGSGKSSTARAVMGLEAHASGSINILGNDILSLPRRRLQALRPSFQMVFQDPYGSLDPRHSISRIIAEPLPRSPRADIKEAVARSLEAVGLKASDASRYPHQFSGGQRQRIAIARALVTRPSLIVADEAVSALDVSVQAQVLNLMKDIQAEFGGSYLFISHDLSVIDYMCSDVMVMFRGRIVESGPTQEVLRDPVHPYTRELINAMPRLGQRRRSSDQRFAVAVAERETSPTGCPYLARCPLAIRRCVEEVPLLRADGGRAAACHLAWRSEIQASASPTKPNEVQEE